jgi:hypothetical protein
LRNEVAALFDTDDLRGYTCIQTWQLRKHSEDKKPPEEKNAKLPDLSLLAAILKILLITSAIMLIAWLLYRYRGNLYGWSLTPRFNRATEVGGLDIRPETLPDDVATAVRQLWEKKQYRAALALLYRATLSRLVEEGAVLLSQGSTEGDCLRLAQQAHAANRLNDIKLEIATSATSLWLRGAYGNRWPDTETVMAQCAQWHAHFGKSPATMQVQG